MCWLCTRTLALTPRRGMAAGDGGQGGRAWDTGKAPNVEVRETPRVVGDEVVGLMVGVFALRGIVAEEELLLA